MTDWEGGPRPSQWTGSRVTEAEYPTWKRAGHGKISSAQVQLSTEAKGKDEGLASKGKWLCGGCFERKIFEAENPSHMQRPEMKA